MFFFLSTFIKKKKLYLHFADLALTWIALLHIKVPKLLEITMLGKFQSCFSSLFCDFNILSYIYHQFLQSNLEFTKFNLRFRDSLMSNNPLTMARPLDCAPPRREKLGPRELRSCLSSERGVQTSCPLLEVEIEMER